MFYKGNPVSKGIALGKVYVYKPYTPEITEKTFEPFRIDEYLQRYKDTKASAEMELQRIHALLSDKDPEKAKIFAAHIDIVNDVAITEEIMDAIQYDHFEPDYAIETVFSKYIKMISKSKDPVIRERAADFQDVKNRLIRNWHGIEESNLSTLSEPVVVAAYDLLPSDTAALDRKNVIAIITETGSFTSHSAIIARSYEIPAILGIPSLMSFIRHGEEVIVDAISGDLITEPGKEQIEQYTLMRSQYIKKVRESKEYLDKEPLTKDGVRIDIGLNIGSGNDEEIGHSQFSDFVGLFRTEFLYMSGDSMPTEEQQFEVYKNVLSGFKDKPVYLRTLDIGADKTLPYLDLPKEENPFLGCRGLRLCFDQINIFKTQLRAALRASVFGKLCIMLPMVSCIEDIRSANAIIEEVKSELSEIGIPFDSNVKIGVMIEVPSAALIADMIAKEVDFASIGTNDLCQYITAADRLNPKVTQYYQSYHPALFRLIDYIVSSFNKAGKPISVCGELGGDPQAIPVLVGLGLRRLSMSSSAVASAKAVLSNFTMDQMKEMAQQVKMLPASEDVIEYLVKTQNIKE
ncbi:MAG TPA: phosphoenolpyruvate--protein phosphotransferase [Clostridiales bacterium]|nr:phosphoenolpyruvate--protein phosphotransferase [Clostridiales bacterium]